MSPRENFYSSSESLKKRAPSSGLLTVQDYCRRAEELLKKCQWNSAQKVLQKGLLEVGKSAKAYHLLGLSFYHQGFFQLALSHLQRACGMEKNSEYFINLSIVLNELGQYEKAGKAYKTAEAMDHQSREQNWKEEIADRHNQTAETYLKKNQLKPALEEYIKGFEYCQNPEGQIQIAGLLWRLNQKKIAQKYLRNFICLYPEDVSARLLLASWYFESKELVPAVREWETVLKIQPQNGEAYRCLLKVQNILE